MTEDILMDELEELGILEDDDEDSGRGDEPALIDESFPTSLVRE